jgi:hypothetical protein
MAKTKLTPRGIIYWLPTGEAVSDFVNTKINPFINENEELAAAKAEDSMRSTDNQGLRFMWGIPIFVRGLKSKTQVKSISADAAIYDEFDEAEPGQVAQARKRLSASTVRISVDLSTPTLPDYGIDQRFQETDQRHYAFKCESCSTWNILEDNWPNTFEQDKDGHYYAACRKCRKKLDLTNGTWVAKQNGFARGYHISQLYSPFVSPDEIMREYQNTEFMGHFYNHVLGLPYLSATDRVTHEHIMSLCDPLFPMPAMYGKPTAMGIDVGSNLNCVVVDVAKPHRVIHIDTYKQFEDLDRVMLKYNVQQVVLDALPETRKVKEFIARHKSKSWACFYSEHQKGSYAWKEDERIVSVNRTEVLDTMTGSLLERRIIMPQASTNVGLMAYQIANLAKVIEEDRETGERRATWRKLGPDHYGHALSYSLIAASRLKHGGVSSVFR